MIGFPHRETRSHRQMKLRPLQSAKLNKNQNGCPPASVKLYFILFLFIFHFFEALFSSNPFYSLLQTSLPPFLAFCFWNPVPPWKHDAGGWQPFKPLSPFLQEDCCTAIVSLDPKPSAPKHQAWSTEVGFWHQNWQESPWRLLNISQHRKTNSVSIHSNNQFKHVTEKKHPVLEQFKVRLKTCNIYLDREKYIFISFSKNIKVLSKWKINHIPEWESSIS